jgi:hypothetical protein
MKKIVFVAISCLFFSMAFSQDAGPSKTAKTKSSKMNNIAADHFMMQCSSDHWLGMPDSIDSHQSGFSRGFNAYFMYNKFLKTNPKLSLAGGLGVSTSNIYFKKMNVDLIATTPTLPFTHLDSTNHFKKYKVATTYLQIPLEFRYFSRPDDPNKSFKVAIGAKVGTLLNAHSKGKTMENKNGQEINAFAQKELSKRYISSTQYMATLRIGYGIFSAFGSYQLNNVLKNGTGPGMHLLQVGLTISGL